MIAYLNAKGVHGDHILLNFQGWTAAWIGGSGGQGSPSYISPGHEQDFATMIASLMYYGKVVKGLVSTASLRSTSRISFPVRKDRVSHRPRYRRFSMTWCSISTAWDFQV